MRQHSENSINYRVLCKTSPFVKTTSEKAERTVLRLAVWLLVFKNDDGNQTTTRKHTPLKDRLPQRPPSTLLRSAKLLFLTV